MLKLTSLLVATPLLLAAAPAVAAPVCPAPGGGDIAVAVRLGTAPVNYRTDLDRARLSKFAGGMAVARHRGDIMGLTVANFGVEIKARHDAVQAADGRWCLSLRRVEARLFIPDMTVYVASDYAKGSCAHRNILEHEHEHVRLTEAALRGAGPRLEARLKTAAAEVSPVVVTSMALADKAVDAALARSVRPFMAELSRQAGLANQAIDTDASYARVAGNCRRW